MIEIIDYASIPPSKMALDMNAVVFTNAQESPLGFHLYWTERGGGKNMEDQTFPHYAKHTRDTH